MPPKILIKARAVISDGHQLLLCWEQRKKFFMLPGGTLAPGESVEACLRRELKEEISLETAIGPLLGCLEWHWQAEEQTYQELNLIFKMRAPAGLLESNVASNEPHLRFQTVLLTDLKTTYNVMPPGTATLVSNYYHREGGLYAICNQKNHGS